MLSIKVMQSCTKRFAEYCHLHVPGMGCSTKKMYLALIKKSFDTLSAVGNIGKKRDDIAQGLYSYQIKKHTVYFRDTDQEFIVLRILHSRMDLERHWS